MNLPLAHVPDPAPDYSGWHALNAIRQAAIREGRCTSCAAPSPSIHTPAAYAWVGRNGNTEYLCVRHCAMWRAFAADDPALMPASIRSLS